MASLVRAARFFRVLPSVTSQFTRQSPFSRTACLKRQICFPESQTIPRFLSSQAQAAPVTFNNNDAAASRRSYSDRLMIDVETNLYRFGRISYNQVKNFIQAIDNEGKVTSDQALLVLRSLGSGLFDEHPKFRSEITQQVWDKFQKYGLQMEVTHYNALLRNHLQNRHSFEPSQFLEMMEKNQVAPNRVTYQNLISQYCEMGDIEGASKILEHMKSADLAIGEQVFNSLITGHFRAGDAESAKEILNVMKTAGLDPSYDTYVALICGYVEQGKPELVQEAIQEVDKEGILLRPNALLKVIFEMAQNNLHESIPKVISSLSAFRGWNQDAISCINQLVCSGHDKVAFDIFCAMPKPMQAEDNDLTLGRFFIRAIVKNEMAVDKVQEYVNKMREEGWNRDDLSFPTQIAYIYNKTDFALKLLDKMLEENLPVRKHYFWPAFCQYAENQNKEGFMKVFKKMLDLFESDRDTAVMHEYVIPGMVQLGLTVDEIQRAFTDSSISDSDFNCYYLSYLLEHDTLENSIKFIENKQFIPVIGAIRPYLLQQYKNTSDWRLVVKMIKMCQEMNPPSKPFADMVSSWLILVIRRKNMEDLEAILDEMHQQNIQVVGNTSFVRSSDAVPQSIQAKFKNIFVSVASTAGAPLSSYTTTQLEGYLRNSNSGLAKKMLLTRYCISGDVARADQLKASLDKEGFLYPASLLRQLVFLNAVHKKDLKEAQKYLSLMEEQYPDYTDYTRGLLNVAALMISEGQVSDALALLGSYVEKHADYMSSQEMSSTYMYEKDCSTIVANCAKTQDLAVSKQVLTKLFELGFIKPATFELLETIMRGYIEREDCEQVLEALDWLITEYSRAPCVDNILQLFIAKEDPEKLQRVIDRVTPIHGELNILHQLMVNLVECGHYKKARKILETPGIRASMIRLKVGCENLVSKDKVTELEQIVELTKNLFGVDRDEMLFQLIRGYVKIEDFKKAKNVLTFYEEEGISPSGRTLRYLAKVLENNGDEISFTVPTVNEDKFKRSSIVEDDILRQVKENRMKMAKDMIRKVESSGILVSEELLTQMAEFLYKMNRRSDLGWVLQQFGSRGSVEKLLLLKSKGIDTTNNIIDKNLFSAYIVSDRIDELMKLLGKNPDKITSYVSVKGIASLKEKDPESLAKFEELAYRCEPATKKSILWNIWQVHFLEDPKSSKASVILERNPELLHNSSILGLCRKAVQENKEDVFKGLLTYFTQAPPLKFIYGQYLFIPISRGDVEGSLALIKECEDRGIPADSINQASLTRLKTLLTQKQIPIPWKANQRSAAAATTTTEDGASSDSSDSDSDSDHEKERMR
ncbi:leucine-rich PPR motif-containing protein, mitochondrial-like [Argonauta hians]